LEEREEGKKERKDNEKKGRKKKRARGIFLLFFFHLSLRIQCNTMHPTNKSAIGWGLEGVEDEYQGTNKENRR
jgi:hypothetical protein